MNELRTILAFVGEHKVHWFTLAMLASFLFLRRVMPWFTEKFTLIDRATLDLVDHVFEENRRLRNELDDARDRLLADRRVPRLIKSQPENKEVQHELD